MMGVITDDNGLYHMRARYYNPQIKRFINQDVLTGNIANSSSLNRYSYVEGNPISYTDPFGLSPMTQAIHAGLDILGAIPLPFFEIFDAANAIIYFVEGNWGEAIKSIVYMTPGMDLLGKATSYAVKGGKYAKQALAVAEYATIASRTMAALMSAEDFGKAIGGMIDKYLVYDEKVTWDIAYDFLMLAATGVQLGFYTGSALKMPDVLAKYDFDEIMAQNIRARYETTAVDGYISGVTVNYSTLRNSQNGCKEPNWEAHNVVNYAKYKEVLRTTEAANPLIESLRTTGKLPSNYITKAEAMKSGWKPGKALGNFICDAQIGGDEFLNTNGIVPNAFGREWYEADVGLTNSVSRPKQAGTRLLYSNDGLLYITYDHYKTAYSIGKWK